MGVGAGIDLLKLNKKTFVHNNTNLVYYNINILKKANSRFFKICYFETDDSSIYLNVFR